LKKWFWSAKACRSEAEIPLCGAFAVFKLVRELDFPNQFRAGHQDSAKGGREAPATTLKISILVNSQLTPQPTVDIEHTAGYVIGFIGD
jgi:hypothetical protein